MNTLQRTALNDPTNIERALNASLLLHGDYCILHADYCILKEALQRIANQDYLGNAPTEVSIAREALSKINNT